MSSDTAVSPGALKTDVVVIGAGGSGLAAAVTAATKGAKVVILEKQGVAGGNTGIAEGIFAAESEPQKRLGINVRKDEVFKATMDWAHWRINHKIIRNYIDKSDDTIQWLEDKGVNFDSVISSHRNPRFLTWHWSPPIKAGPLIVKALLKDCEALGIRLFYQTRAIKLFCGDKGEVTGVIAISNGEELRINARIVIIGSGGYGGNKKLLKKYCPYYSDSTVLAGVPNMGDGILMATEIGADTESMGVLLNGGPALIDKPRGNMRLIDKLASEPRTIWVNKNGERFIDENIYLWPVSANALNRQPDGISYSLFDDKIKQTFLNEVTANNPMFSGQPEELLVNLEMDFQLEAKKGAVKISDYWDDIYNWIGVDTKILKATIDEYNSFCDRGYDEIFTKEQRYLQPLRNPPYYAMRCAPFMLVSLGGIKINHRMEALDKQGNPIPGLYAVGIDAGSWVGDTYNLEIPGFSLGFAINSGRIAGENAAKVLGR